MFLNKILPLIPVFLFTFFIAFQAEAAADRGKALFKQCASCHGEKGEGKQNLEAPAIAGLPEWYILAQVKKFDSGVRGKHHADAGGLRMRPMAKTLDRKGDIEAVSSYVASLSVNLTPATLGANSADGQMKYGLCAACHGQKAEGNVQLGAPPLANQSDWYMLTQLKNFRAGIRGSDASIDMTGAQMAGIAKTLSDEDMLSVLAYIKTLK